MAQRPWVTPQEVKDYSEIPAVQQRSDTRLTVDIARAEQYVITYTHNSFKDEEEIPPPVKTAVLSVILHKKQPKIAFFAMIKPNFWRFLQSIIVIFGDYFTRYCISTI